MDRSNMPENIRSEILMDMEEAAPMTEPPNVHETRDAGDREKEEKPKYDSRAGS